MEDSRMESMNVHFTLPTFLYFEIFHDKKLIKVSDFENLKK